MLSFDDALARVLASSPSLPAEIVSLEEADGRVLAEDLRAASALPPHDYSAMDGYALCTADLEGEPPWTLPVRGESRTGSEAPALEPRTACRIFTGAPIPRGADAVVMQENVERSGSNARLARRPLPGDHVRRAGEDLAEGALALSLGTRLGALQLGLVAALDRASVKVSRRPRVTLVSTGDELRAPGSPDRPASIPDSNGIAIASLARRAGATVRREAACGDAVEVAAERLRGALEGADLLVTIGGVSVGDHDVVRPALEAAGVSLEFHKVAMKPGKPLTLGRRGETLVLGLPGNPVSAQVTFALFGVPLLRRMQGDRRAVPATRIVRLSHPLRQKPGRRGFYAVTLDGDLATPLASQSSGSTTALAHADALVVVPEGSEGLPAGASAQSLPLGEP
jgi:molybdopterin molybdotransferase